MKKQVKIYCNFTSTPWFWFFVICLLTVLAYSNTFNIPFVFDGIDNIVRNPYLRFESLSWKYINDLQFSLNNKRPVSLFSFGLNYYFGRYNLFGFHLVNLIIHLLNGLMLFIIMKKTLRLYQTEFTDYRSPITDYRLPLFATAFWLLNPIQIFSVTYIVQRMNSLAAMFTLLSLLCYIKMREYVRGDKWDVRSGKTEIRGQRSEAEEEKNIEHSTRATDSPTHRLTDSQTHRLTDSQTHRLTDSQTHRLTDSPVTVPLAGLCRAQPTYRLRITDYFLIISLGLLCVISAVLGIGSKPNAALIPLLILLYEFYFFQNSVFGWLKKCWRRKWLSLFGLLIILVLIAGFVYIVFYHTGSNPWKFIMSQYKGRDFNLTERLLTQSRVVMYYLSLMFYPNPSRMALLIDINKSTSLLQPLTTLFSVVFIGILFLSALIFAKRYRLFSFAVIWFFIGHLLESTFIPVEMIYIHRNYLPTMFLYLPIVAGLFAMLRKQGVKYIEKNEGECNKVTDLPTHRLTDSPTHRLTDSPTHRLTDSQTNRLTDSQTHRLTDLQKPTWLIIFLTLILFVFGVWTYSYNEIWKDRHTLWEDNISKFPDLARPHANLAGVLIEKGELDKALNEYKTALKINPGDIKNLYNTGVVYEKQGKYMMAVKQYSKALKKNKWFADAWCNQGNCLIKLGYYDDGLSCLYQAFKLQKLDPKINYNLAMALMKKKEFKGVLFHLHRAIESDPYYFQAYLNLGLTYLKLKNYKAAANCFYKALELRPNSENVKSFLRLAETLSNKKLPGNAVEVKNVQIKTKKNKSTKK